MTVLPRNIEKYLRTRAIRGPWRIAGTEGKAFAGAVVIPVLAEGEHLFATLGSIAANPPRLLERFLVLVVVNHRQDCAAADKADNLATLARLAGGDPGLAGLQLGWVDAASPGLELPAGQGGVGMARRIGFDLALPHLAHRGPEPLLVSLDGDTLVDADYLPALVDHFARHPAGGAVLPFCHQPAGSAPLQAAIERYELFLRHYVLGLELAGSPYAYHTVGSALACRAGAYAASGGMNRRTAGEDFYFLQQLTKTCGVSRLTGTTVAPSARPSRRVPFGTGPSVARLLAGEADAVLFYPVECFRLLGAWLELVRTNGALDGNSLCDKALRISGHLGEFLDHADFARVWNRLRGNHPEPAALHRAFHGWFDALKTLRLVHHLCAGPWPKTGPEAALPNLLAWAALPPATGIAELLARLRDVQGAWRREPHRLAVA